MQGYNEPPNIDKEKQIWKTQRLNINVFPRSSIPWEEQIQLTLFKRKGTYPQQADSNNSQLQQKLFEI